MKTFHCACGARVFFENTRCLACRRELAFLPDRLTVSAIEPAAGDRFKALTADASSTANRPLYRKCENYSKLALCNWLVAGADEAVFCVSCRLNQVIPDLSIPEGKALWARVEAAKRHLIYTLIKLGLPVRAKTEDEARGLAFVFKLSRPEEPVLTGHADGLITLNIAEADPVAREEMRVKMRERYRTLLGHFRHEIGHYYWTLLVDGSTDLPRFRELFGDEREDYGEALKRHYASAPEKDWAEKFITPYASAHPWEDWAESWAHYLHMMDTFETAQHFGMVSAAPRVSVAGQIPAFNRLLEEWIDLIVALNALNRSMGLADPYPFEIAPRVAQKLELVHTMIYTRALAHAKVTARAAAS